MQSLPTRIHRRPRDYSLRNAPELNAPRSRIQIQMPLPVDYQAQATPAAIPPPAAPIAPPITPAASDLFSLIDTYLLKIIF